MKGNPVRVWNGDDLDTSPEASEPNLVGAAVGTTFADGDVGLAAAKSADGDAPMPKESWSADSEVGLATAKPSDCNAAMPHESWLVALFRWCLTPKFGPAAAKYGISSHVGPALSACELWEGGEEPESNAQLDPAQCSFKAIRLIGSGSFARVHLAEENSSGRQFAVKIMSKEEMIKQRQVDHVHRLKVNTEACRHPFLVKFILAQQTSRALHLIMELAEKGDMFSPLRRRKKFTEEMSRFYSAQIVCALAYMHDSKHIVHRNIKPEACLLDGKGFCKLASFIFTKRMEPGAKTYTLCGTPEYIAPEILLKKGHSFPVDWWSLGVLTYEFLVGQPVFVDEDPMGVYQKILAGKIYYPRYVSAIAKDLVNGLLRADLSKRLGAEGSSQVASHKFFSLDWQQLLYGTVPPNCEALTPDELSLPDDHTSAQSELPNAVIRSCDPFNADWGSYVSEEIP